MTQPHDTIKRMIDKIPGLATLSTVAIEITQLIEQEDISLSRIIRLLETDPSLTIKVLQVANSPFYGAQSRIHTIDQALRLIGLNELCNVLLNIAIHSKMFHMVSGKSKEMELLWRHSLECAHISRSIATKLQIRTAGREYIAGLLHDIGKIVLIEYYETELEKICILIEEEQVSDLDAEKKLVGVTHEEIGFLLGQTWGLPDSFINVIRYHHAPRQDTSTMILSAVVHIADFLCVQWGVSAFERVPQTSLNDNEGWQILLENHRNMADTDPEKIVSEVKKELETLTSFPTAEKLNNNTINEK